MIDELPTLVLDDDRTLVEIREPQRPIRSKRRFVPWCIERLRRVRPFALPLLTASCIIALATWACIDHDRLERLRADLDELRRATPSTESIASGGVLGPLETSLPPRNWGAAASAGLPLEGLDVAQDRPARPPSGPSKADTVEPTPARAAELIAQNRFEEALRSYRRLADAHPGETVYSVAVRVLEAKLACVRRERSEGPPCAL